MTESVGPKKKPQEFGFKPGDTHLIVNDVTETIKAYSYYGELMWTVPALARGQGAENEWDARNTDTPPALYKLGTLYDDYGKHGRSPDFDRTLMAYGWQSYEMVCLDGTLDASGRAGLMIHGGGSGNGWPGAWDPYQLLLPTFGCIRMKNSHLLHCLYPRYVQGTVFVSVFQES